MPLIQSRARPSPSIVWRLGLVVLSVLVPAVVFAGLTLWHYASAERTRLEETAVALARSTAVAVDRELSALMSVADIIALSPGVQQGEVEAFERRAREVERRLGVKASLLSLDGYKLGAADTALPRIDDVRRVIDSGKTFISDYVSGHQQDGGAIFVIVPVRTDSGVPFVVALQVHSDRLRSIILSEDPPNDWVVALVDRSGTIVARSRGQETFVGRRATDDLLANTTGVQGTWLGYTQEGTEVLGAYQRTKPTDWRVAVGVSRATLNAPLYRSLWVLAAVAVGLSALSLFLTRRFGKHITAAMGNLVLSAERLSRGELVHPPNTAVSEVNEIGARLADASRSLRDRHAAEERAAAADRRVRTIFESIRDSVFVLDQSWRFTYLNNRAHDQISGGRDLIGQNIWEAFPEAVGGEIWRAYHQAMETGEATYAEQRYEPLGRWFAASAYPSSEGLTVYFRDVTAEKEIQEQQALMVRELHHRIRNLLSSVQAIATATARSATSVEGFQNSFVERLAALSRSHTLLMQNSWGRISLADLVGAELEPHADRLHRVRVEGPDVHLPSDSALSLGMAIHELTTNALRHGSLSSATGRVEVRWGVEGSAGDSFLRLSWVESGGPAAREPERTGFGSQLLDRVLKRQLRAEVEIKYLAAGLQVDLRAPLTQDSAHHERR